MKPTEPTTNASTPKTGLLALLCGLLHVQGTGAPEPSQGTGAPSPRVSMNARRLTSPTLAVLCAVTGALLVSSTPALAVIAHPYVSQLTGPSLSESFSDPWGLAFDSTGSVYVADATVNVEGKIGAIDIFNPLNVFQPPQLNDASVGATPFTGPYVRSVAVDNLPGPNHGTVYVAESNGEYVDVFKPEGGGKYKLAQERKFGFYMYVAFDNSSGPNAGKLYVFEESHVVLVTLNSDGTLPVSEVEPGVTPLKAPPKGFSIGAVNGAGGLAVGPTGKVYLANPAEKAVDVYSNADVLELATITGSETPGGAESFEPIDVAVDPSTGEIYVVDAANKAVDQFSSVGKYLGQIKEAKPSEPLVTPLGVAVNSTGHVYVSDGAAKVVDVFGLDVVLPDVTTEAATEPKQTSVTLNGTVNPDGIPLSECYFEYDTSEYPTTTSPAHGARANCKTPWPAGSSPVPVSAEIAPLRSGTTYHFRLIAANANGTNRGLDETVTTKPPAIDGEWATNVSSTSATLDAQINPLGEEVTDCKFEYGTGVPYEKSAPCVPSPGSGSGDVLVSAHVQGLQAGTVYHYRVVASNGLGSAPGADQTFTTQSTGGEFALPDGRAWELVSPPNKHGAQVEPIPEFGPLIQASEGGGAFTYGTRAGPVEAEPPGNLLSDAQVLATRGAGGWSSREITAPNEEVVGYVKHAVGHSEEYKFFSPDLSLGLLEPEDQAPLPPLEPGAEKTVYLREAGGEYVPLVTSANVPEGTKFGGQVGFISASPDLSHVVLQSQVGSQVALTSTPAPGGACMSGREGVCSSSACCRKAKAARRSARNLALAISLSGTRSPTTARGSSGPCQKMQSSSST